MSKNHIKKQNHAEVTPTSDKPVCSVCGETPHDGNGDWPPGTSVFHCPGNSQAFNVQFKGQYHHSARILHKPCYVCGAPLGCLRCSGIASELLCMAKVSEGASYDHDAAHWGSKSALRKHGQLILDPAVRKEAMAFLHSAVERIGAKR